MRAKHFEAIQKEVLSDRAMRFRRTTIALAIILTGLHFFPNSINAKDLSFFGVRIEESLSGRGVLLFVLWASLVYNAISFFLYAVRDFQIWKTWACMRVAGTDPPQGYPNTRMLLGWPRMLPPPKKINNSGLPINWTFNPGCEGSAAVWRGDLPADENGNERKGYTYALDFGTRHFLRNSFVQFIILEMGLPTVLFALAVSFGVNDMLYWSL